MKRMAIVAALALFLCCPTRHLEAAENLRAASGGFTTAIHAVLWAANEERIFRKYSRNVEDLAQGFQPTCVSSLSAFLAKLKS